MTEPNNEENPAPRISWPRKIIILIFIIGFWVFFYWYQESSEPPQPAKNKTETTSEIQETAP